jgi:hypothetical protein
MPVVADAEEVVEPGSVTTDDGAFPPMFDFVEQALIPAVTRRTSAMALAFIVVP